MANTDARLANRILLGLVLGAVAGAIVLAVGARVPALLEGARWFATTICDPLGQVFLRMLSFVVIPLVFASLQTVPPRLQRPELDPNGAARASLSRARPGAT